VFTVATRLKNYIPKVEIGPKHNEYDKVVIQNAVSDEWKNHCTDEALRDCIPRMLLNSVYNCGVTPFLERKFTFRK